MAWKLTSARYCLLFLALHTEAARPHRSMHVLDLDEERTLSKLRFEAGDPACGRSQFLYECVDGPWSIASHTPTPSTQEEPAAVVEDAQVVPKHNLQDRSDCGPLGHHKYRCTPPTETTVKNAAVARDAQILPEDRSDCGPLGQHKFRCVPPTKTQIKTTAPEDVSPVNPSVQEASAQSNCGPLSKEKYRCVPPML